MNLQAEIPFNYNPWSVSPQTISRIWISVCEDTDQGADVLLINSISLLIITKKSRI